MRILAIGDNGVVITQLNKDELELLARNQTALSGSVVSLDWIQSLKGQVTGDKPYLADLKKQVDKLASVLDSLQASDTKGSNV